MDEEIERLSNDLAALSSPGGATGPQTNTKTEPKYKAKFEMQQHCRNYFHARKLYETRNLQDCVEAAKMNLAEQSLPPFLQMMNSLLLVLSVKDPREAKQCLRRAKKIYVEIWRAHSESSERAKEVLGWSCKILEKVRVHWAHKRKVAREGKEHEKEKEEEAGKDKKGKADDVVTVKKAKVIDEAVVVKEAEEQADGAAVVNGAVEEADDAFIVEKADGHDSDENEDGFVEIDELYI